MPIKELRVRFVGLAILLLLIPICITFLNRDKRNRDWAVLALGFLMFITGSLHVDVSLYGWPTWPGIARGILFSPTDVISIALIVTRRSKRHERPPLLLYCLLLFPQMLSIFFADLPIATIFVVVSTLRYMLFFYALGGELSRPSAIRALLVGLSCGLVIQAGYVINQKLHGAIQATGSADHQNEMGMMIELAILPLVGAVLENFGRRRILYVGIAACLIVIAGGGSRATLGFVGAGIPLLLLVSYLRRPSPHKIKIIGAAALAIGLAIPLALGTLSERFGDRSVVTQETVRDAFKRAAHEMSRDHPFGVGANMFVVIDNTKGYADRAGLGWFSGNRNAPVHNGYLLARAETGWIGEICMILLLGISGFWALRTAFRSRKDPVSGVALGCAAAILVTALHNNFEFAWFTEPIQRIFVLNLSLVYGCDQYWRLLRKQQRRELKKKAKDQMAEDLAPSHI
ncbi:hypothetical protein GRI58_07535 [Porphyrobacter algicida]|uniref:O-antigen ligase-related domain-containing protein n=1 Tax=Qipengyuania algicida TaxID=1836209 RepID=A0A845AEJ9_9SPHN|nr:hypothetical protein [Qipengyuania algicida]